MKTFILGFILGTSVGSCIFLYYWNPPMVRLGHTKVMVICEPLAPKAKTKPMMTELTCDSPVSLREVLTFQK